MDGEPRRSPARAQRSFLNSPSILAFSPSSPPLRFPANIPEQTCIRDQAKAHISDAALISSSLSSTAGESSRELSIVLTCLELSSLEMETLYAEAIDVADTAASRRGRRGDLILENEGRREGERKGEKVSASERLSSEQ